MQVLYSLHGSDPAAIDLKRSTVAGGEDGYLPWQHPPTPSRRHQKCKAPNHVVATMRRRYIKSLK